MNEYWHAKWQTGIDDSIPKYVWLLVLRIVISYYLPNSIDVSTPM